MQKQNSRKLFFQRGYIFTHVNKTAEKENGARHDTEPRSRLGY